MHDDTFDMNLEENQLKHILMGTYQPLHKSFFLNSSQMIYLKPSM